MVDHQVEALPLTGLVVLAVVAARGLLLLGAVQPISDLRQLRGEGVLLRGLRVARLLPAAEEAIVAAPLLPRLLPFGAGVGRSSGKLLSFPHKLLSIKMLLANCSHPHFF